MKRLFMLLLVGTLALSSAAPTQAQVDHRWEIKASAGLLSTPEYINLILIGLGSLNFDDNLVRQEFTPCTALNVEIYRQVNHWLQVGASLSSGYANVNTTQPETGTMSRHTGSFHTSLCLTANTRYKQKKNLSYYGSWGLGASMFVLTQKGDDLNETNVAPIPMLNIYPFCMKIGNLRGAYLEFGWGAKGIVNFGGFVRF